MSSKKDEAAMAIMRHASFTEEIAEMILRPGGAHRALGALEREFYGLITVPDLSSADLIALAKMRCDLTQVYPDYRQWDMFEGADGRVIRGRDKTFRVSTWTPSRDVYSRDVREHFKANGFYGHAAAFIAWFINRMPRSPYAYATIPDDNGCYHSSGGMYAPRLESPGPTRILGLHSYYSCWDAGWTFVGFKE